VANGYDLTRESLVILAQVFATITGVKFPRDYTRRRTLIIKWFDNNIELFEPVVRLIQLDLVECRTSLNAAGSGRQSADEESERE
jgi:hypothetical protein